MGKEKSEKSHFDMANRIYAQINNTQTELFRLFRVYHPVYEISVNIESEQVDDNYHIIEKYMDKLICGYIGDNKTLGNGIFIKDKDELFKLLGIDEQAYEIAEGFYNDLMEAGHFIEVPNTGIQGCEAARKSIKLEKRVISTTVREKKLFDQFSAKLMPQPFYDFRKYACDRETLNEENPILKNSVWLKPNVTVLNTKADIEQMLGNFNYVNTERIERGLPQGFRKISIAKEDEPVKMSFYPYYLAILKRESDFEYAAFRNDNGQPIEWIGKQYKTGYYRTVVDLLKRLVSISEENVKNPLNRNFNITLEGNPDAKNGITKDEKTGNYNWKIQDWQIKDLLGLGEDKKFKRASCLMIANNEIICLTSYEAGKIVHIIKSDEQKKLLLATADAALSVEERSNLFTTYLEGKERKYKRIMKARILYDQKHYLEAMEILVEFAEVDDECAFKLGYMYGNAYGVPRDDEKACYWYGVSAKLGNKIAKLNLGRRYQNGKGVPKDVDKAFEFFTKAACQGEVNAIYELGRCYEEGKGVKQNWKEAIKYYEVGAMRGNKEAMKSLANQYESGEHVNKDLNKAFELYEKLAVDGNTFAKEKVKKVKELIAESKKL